MLRDGPLPERREVEESIVGAKETAFGDLLDLNEQRLLHHKK